MLSLDVTTAIATVTLDRPEVHNAFNDALIRRITETFLELGSDPAVRVVILRANGDSFSAGGDLNWMRRAAGYSAEENLRDARAGAQMFLTVARCPKPVIARVHARALGGGSGLVACCDMAVAVKDAEFGFPEVRIGLVPGIIGPFVIARIGIANARECFLTGQRFPAGRALEIGLVNRVVDDERALDDCVQQWVNELMTASPSAIAEAKNLIFNVSNRSIESVLETAALSISNARSSPEGKAGVEAFLAREKPPWVQ